MFSSIIKSVNTPSSSTESSANEVSINKDLVYRPTGMFGVGAKSRNGRR